MIGIGAQILIGSLHQVILYKFWRENMKTGIQKINEIVSSGNLMQLLQSQLPSMNRQRKNGQNLRQRALLISYPEPKDFYEDYSPDLQAKLITCNAQLAGFST